MLRSLQFCLAALQALIAWDRRNPLHNFTQVWQAGPLNCRRIHLLSPIFSPRRFEGHPPRLDFGSVGRLTHFLFCPRGSDVRDAAAPDLAAATVGVGFGFGGEISPPAFSPAESSSACAIAVVCLPLCLSVCP